MTSDLNASPSLFPVAPNRVSWIVSPRRSVVTTEPVPQPGIGQVLIRVLINGICASDVADWASAESAARLRLGHEPVGEVVAVGAGVRHIRSGDLVAGRVSPSLCDFALAEQGDLVVVPPGLTPEQALGEPLGCVVEGVRRTKIDAGDRIAVVGTGFMGLCLLQLLRRTLSSQIVAVDSRADARAHALTHGADQAVDPLAADVDAVSADGPTDGRGFDVVFEASGSQAGLDLASRLVRSHGVVSILGYHQQVRNVDMQMWNGKAIDVVNAHVRDGARLRDSTRRGLDLAAAGRIDVGSLITHRYALDKVDEAFDALIHKPDGYIKAIIEIG